MTKNKPAKPRTIGDALVKEYEKFCRFEHERDLRISALELAVEAVERGTEKPENTVARAEAFFSFLSGKTAPDSPKLAPVVDIATGRSSAS